MRIILSILLLSVCYPLTDCIVLSPENIEDYSTLYPLDETNTSQQNWCNQMLVEYDGDCPSSIYFYFDYDTLISPSIFQDNVSTKEVTFQAAWANVESLVWDSNLFRYTVHISDDINSVTASMYDNTDIYDSLIYIGFIDTNQYSIDNLTILDRNNWGKHYDTTYSNLGESIILDTTLTYSQIRIPDDSPMYRINGDCNQNLSFDLAEIFYDYGADWCPDSLETGADTYTDVNENGSWEESEPLINDWNEDGKWTKAFCNVVDTNNDGLLSDEEPCNCLGNWIVAGVTELNADWVADNNIDPNGDNWRDCGWDGMCSEDAGYEGADFNGTEGNGIWDYNEGFEENGKYDFDFITGTGEYFVDVGNGVFNESAEYYFDENLNGAIDIFQEIFEDRNCNGKWDDTESGDQGNGIWDDAELFTDTNGNEVWDLGEPLYRISDKMVTFIVDYSDPSNPTPVTDIDYTTSVTLYYGTIGGGVQYETFDSLFISEDVSYEFSKTFYDIDFIKTIYTNEIIEYAGNIDLCDCEGDLYTCALCPNIDSNGYGNCSDALGYAYTGVDCVSINGCGYGNDEEWFSDTYDECNGSCQNCNILDVGGYGPCEMVLGWGWTGEVCELISGCGAGAGVAWFDEDKHTCMTRCYYGYNPGCTNETACNYDSSATDAGDCTYASDCETCNASGGVDANDIDADGVCDADEVVGCMDTAICNYNSVAEFDDGSCLAVLDGFCETCSGEQDGTGTIVDNDANDNGVCDADDLSLYKGLIPEDFKIHSIYPNPFNPVSNIIYGLPEHVNVQIIVYDLSGKQVETLINQFQAPGYHSVNWNADNLPSGIYLIRMDSGDFTQTQKVVLVK